MAAVLVTILFEATLPETDKLNPSEIEFADENRVGVELRDLDGGNCWSVVPADFGEVRFGLGRKDDGGCEAILWPVMEGFMDCDGNGDLGR